MGPMESFSASETAGIRVSGELDMVGAGDLGGLVERSLGAESPILVHPAPRERRRQRSSGATPRDLRNRERRTGML